MGFQSYIEVFKDWRDGEVSTDYFVARLGYEVEKLLDLQGENQTDSSGCDGGEKPDQRLITCPDCDKHFVVQLFNNVQED